MPTMKCQWKSRGSRGLSRTTYFFTETSFEAMIAPIAHNRDDSESQNPNYFKLIEADD